MAEEENRNPNKFQYVAGLGASYLTTRLLTHNGTTVAFALGCVATTKQLFFDYSVLNAAEQETPTPSNPAQKDAVPPEKAEKLDSQCWLENVKSLRFSSELRVVGEEAVPVFKIPLRDVTGLPLGPGQAEKLDPWVSTSLGLMNPDIANFEVISDGRYIYLFRQSRASSDPFLNQTEILNNESEVQKPPIDENILCDRFNLVGSTLSRCLEVRYRRSRQKRLPLNQHDTLGVKDIDDMPFHEPTFSLRFLKDMINGRFSVLQTPTMTNDMKRWMFFIYSSRSRQIECFTTDVTSDGLFDIHGQVYYSCSNGHEKVFSNAPGTCRALTERGDTCSEAKRAIVPKPTSSDRAISLYKETADTSLKLQKPIQLSNFPEGFTLEGWVVPASFWMDIATNDDSEPPDTGSMAGEQYVLPPAGSTFCLFSIVPDDQKSCVSVFLDDHLRLALHTPGEMDSKLVSKHSLKISRWNHIAIIYSAVNRTFNLVVNGITSASATSSSYKISGDMCPGALTGLAPADKSSKFQGWFDEVRLWNHAFHPATIKSKMNTRATGMEPLLEACWHFDEGTGTKAFDATTNGHDIDIVMENPTADVWSKSTAPILSNIGLTKRILRLEPNLIVEGGLGAGMYHEQVSVSNVENSSEKKEEVKPLKRGARILLSFVASKPNMNTYLAVLDLALMSDGNICDTPAIIPVPSLSLTAHPKLKGIQRVSTPQLYVDAQGMEIFGGILTFEAAKSGVEPPVVWDSAAGSITIFFRGPSGTAPALTGTLSALSYDVSRSVELTAITGLSDGEDIRASIKLRQATSISIETKPWKFTPEDVALSLVLTATMIDGTQVVETWQGIPSNLDSFCNLLNGVVKSTKKTIGGLAKILPMPSSPTMTSGGVQVRRNLLMLSQPLRVIVPLAGCVTVGNRHFSVISAARVGDKEILVSHPYATKRPLEYSLGLPVCLLGYDYENLVSCEGKAAGDYSQGSSVLSIFYSDRANSASISSSAKCHFTTTSQSPFFSSPAPSTALKLANNEVYSMLEEMKDTMASPGITFESWIKVEQLAESVIVAYKSQKCRRSERTNPEQQTFILGVRESPKPRSGHDLICNANGSLFSVNNPNSLKLNKWMHFACSSRNTFALKFSGSNFVNLGVAPEFNVSDFSLAFTLQLDKLDRTQILFTKSTNGSSITPLHLTVTKHGALSLSYYAQNETNATITPRHVTSTSTLSPGVPYKIFVSRSHICVNRENAAPRTVQCVRLLAWTANGSLCIEVEPPEKDALKLHEASSNTLITNSGEGPAQASGLSQPNEAPLTFGGAEWAPKDGLEGSIGPIRLYSAAITPVSPAMFCKPVDSERSIIGAWSFKAAEGLVLKDDMNRNTGKLKNNPDWVLSSYEPDHQHTVLIDGYNHTTESIPETVALKVPAGRHQLTLGNVLHGDEMTRFLAMPNSFQGQFDELRIWNVPRTKENITDVMNSRLLEVPVEMAVYLPFDDPEVQGTTAMKDVGFLADASNNCWHLTPLHNSQQLKVSSEAPVSHDSPCVHHVLSSTTTDQVVKTGVQTSAAPSVAEYGDMQISATGGMEGSYKRVYSYIEANGNWGLVTGFKIGSLITEWVSQVQTNPTLIGYIEGAPPIPAENYIGKDDRPSSAIKFSNAGKRTYTLSSRKEVGADLDLTASIGKGNKFKVYAGVGVATEVASGEIKASMKGSVDISGAEIYNRTSTSTTNTNLEMRVELTAAWTLHEGAKFETYDAANTGLALVESEVADVFALRLKVRGPIAPLVAYQMRPNPDIPKDRNLLSFPINDSYTKQGCLDGMRGLERDDVYAGNGAAPTDASYYKPKEAYALKDKIRRKEEQLAGEYEQTRTYAADSNMIMPSRTHRNICNSYVWTADGGTFQETTSTMDMVQTEIGGQLNVKSSFSQSLDLEISAGGILGTCNLDALISTHTNLTQTKEVSSETSFELQTEMPPAIDLRSLDSNKKLVKRPGSVDAYRWMSFFLEGSVEGTDAFFQQVVDPKWLDDGQEPNARLLLKLRTELESQSGNARTKAWRVLHRCTYISRVPETIVGKPTMEVEAPAEKKSTLLADVSCNWHIIQNLEPLVRGAKSRTELAHLAQGTIAKLYPTIRSQPRFYGQLLELLGDYIGLP